jgi:hypothetical protein
MISDFSASGLPLLSATSLAPENHPLKNILGFRR